MARRTPRSGGRRASSCAQCGALAADGATISARDLCDACSTGNANEAARQIKAGEGPYYDEYRRGMLSYIKALSP